jgi:predicted RNase H-like nuclease (RuvC/YqgF family)
VSTCCPACSAQICDEQAAELRRAEEQLSAVEAALQQRTGQVQQLQARVSELESEVESSRHEQRTFGSAIAAKERDHVRRIESLQDEVEHQQEQMAAVEKLLRERAAQLNELKEKVCAGLLRYMMQFSCKLLHGKQSIMLPQGDVHFSKCLQRTACRSHRACRFPS